MREGNRVERIELSNDWYSASDLLKMELKEVPKLWDPFFPQTGIAGLAGSSDCGKSTLFRNLAIAIALNKKEFLGFPLNVRRGHAFYISTEDDRTGIAANMSKHETVYPELRNSDGLHFLFDSEDIITRLDKALTIRKTDAVFVDAWADTFQGGSINNLNDVRYDLGAYKGLSKKHDCLVCILHHMGKRSEDSNPNKNRLNGSQAIEATMRSLIELRNGSNENEKLLSILKGNYISRKIKEHSFQLGFDESTLTFSGGAKFLPTGTVNQDRTIKYNKDLWIGRMDKVQKEKDLSLTAGYKVLAFDHGNEDMPGLTWFKNNYSKSLDQSDIMAG